MNKRQKKKAFKKRFGVNPPSGIKLHDTIDFCEHEDTILLAVERMKAALIDSWERIKEPLIRLYREMRKTIKETEEKEPTARQRFYYSNAWQQQRQKMQESEAMKIDSNINILNHDRR